MEIKYRKGVDNKFVDMLSRLVANALLIMKDIYLALNSYVKQCAKNDVFREVYEALTKGIHNEEVEYHLHNNILYHLGKLCIPRDERVNVIWESHTSLRYFPEM